MKYWYLEIEKLYINGLFHEYDVEIDLRKDCTILIGANGVGKSTVLKILNCFLNGNYVDLGQYIFENIVVLDNEERKHILFYEDFLPPDEYVKNVLVKKIDMLQEEKTELLELMFDELRQKDLLGTLYRKIVKNENDFGYIKRVVEQYIDLEMLKKLNIETEKTVGIECYKNAKILESDYVTEFFVKNLYWHRANYYYIDLVKDIVFCDQEEIRDGQSLFENGKLNVHTTIKEKFLEMYEEDEWYYEFNTKAKLLYDECKNKISVGEVYNNLEKLLEFYSNEVKFIHENYVRVLLNKESVLNVNIQKVIAIVQMRKNKPVETFLEEYIILEAYQKLYEEIKDSILSLDYIDDQVLALKELLEDYFVDKTICITPKGLSVYLKSEDETVYNSEKKTYEVRYSDGFKEEKDVQNIVFGNLEKEIGLNSLSSGEKKIIELLFLSMFSGGAVIMDEPEISISIIWQQRLLQDLLDYGSLKNVIVATHSPYIARNESLSEYIVYMP